MAQGVAQRSDRAYGVHDLVRENAYEFSPGLLFVLLAASLHDPLDAVESLVELAVLREAAVMTAVSAMAATTVSMIPQSGIIYRIS